MKVETITLTRELAQEFLAGNYKNRPLKTRAIQRYADDMIAGRWMLTGESLKFDTDGKMIDGQNRCHALILACEQSEREITIETLIIIGLDREAQDAMDGQVRRTVADQLAMRGRSKSHKLAAALKIIAAYDDSTLLHERVVPRMKLIELYESDKVLLDQCNEEESDYRNSSCINASVRVAARYILLTRVNANSNAVEEFFYKLGSGEDLPAGSPILALRTRALNARNKGVRSRNNLSLALVLRAWNAWRKDEMLYKIPERNQRGEIILPTVVEQ